LKLTLSLIQTMGFKVFLEFISHLRMQSLVIYFGVAFVMEWEEIINELYRRVLRSELGID